MSIKRRKFLKTAVTGLAGTYVFSHSPLLASSNSSFSSSDRINVALIGVRSMGWADLSDLLRVPGVICKALVDIDQNELDRRIKDISEMGLKKPDIYSDYREMLKDKDIDVVIVGTPDHWHCLHAVDSMAAGKHVYVEKPLANSLAEINVMLAAAKKYNRIVQVGQQQRSGNHWKSAIDVVKSDRLGKIRQVKFWGNFNYGSGGNTVADSTIPTGVDYDTWLGPAQERAFNKNRFHGSWRMFRDYGGGLMTDWGVHLIDMGLWAMDIKSAPKSVSASGGTFVHKDNALEFPDTLHVHYDMGDYMMTWEHNGGIESGPWNRNYGVAFIGSSGTLIGDRANWEVIAEGNNNELKMDKIHGEKSNAKSHRNHTANFIEAIRNGAKLNCDIETGHRSAMFAHLGNIAYDTGESIIYDDKNAVFKNSDAANAMINPNYRLPWEFPTL